MDINSRNRGPEIEQKRPKSLLKHTPKLFFLLLGSYLAAAYLVAPLIWKRYAKHHPSLDDIPGITHTKSDIPGDPLNVALIATENDLKKVMLKSTWYPADPLTLRSCIDIAADTVLKRQYDTAPVSSLYLWGRKEDLAFEQPEGGDPRKRHHVRFWRSQKTDPDGRPFWFGAATYDERVGLSDTTGQITHHIAADIDAERNHLMDSLQQSDGFSELYYIDNFHEVREGKNGGGDTWHTDGRLAVGVVVPGY